MNLLSKDIYNIIIISSVVAFSSSVSQLVFYCKQHSHTFVCECCVQNVNVCAKVCVFAYVFPLYGNMRNAHIRKCTNNTCNQMRNTSVFANC